jgi:hypothetical protein
LASGEEEEAPNPEKDGGGGGVLPKKLSSSNPRRRGWRWRSFFGGRTIKSVLFERSKYSGFGPEALNIRQQALPFNPNRQSGPKFHTCNLKRNFKRNFKSNFKRMLQRKLRATQPRVAHKQASG